jgi:TonB family protein
LWNPKDAASPVYIQWITGELSQKKSGVRGKAYVVRDGRLYFPGQKALEKPMALTVLKSAPLDMQLADSLDGSGAASGGDDFEPDTGAAGSEPESSAPEAGASFGAEPESLSNEYIDAMIVSRQTQLQKCWLSRLKDNPELKGQLVVQFEITRRGKVRDLRVADTSMNDEVLNRCVLSVFERIPFQPYKGQEISLSYPINFE